MADTADTILSVIREVTPGVTPTAAPGFRYLDTTDATFNTSAANQITSDITRANRAPGDMVTSGFSVDGSLAGEWRRDTTLELVLESALGSAKASNKIVGGSGNIYNTFEQRMTTGTGSFLYFANAGCRTSEFGLTLDAQSKATWSGSIIGMAQTQRTAIMTGATYTAATQGKLIDGSGAGSITIAGLTATAYSIDLRVTTNLSPKFGLFAPDAFGIATGGNRVTTITIQGYRDDLNPDTVFARNTPIPVSFALGGGVGNVTTVAMPRCFAMPLERQTADNSEMWSVQLYAANDTTLNSEVFFTFS
ncbi:hypothetical protein SAMN05518849_11684 [Sphingobium sp. AP50]|uniref:phage tail tube protein n=1 Tax=Sphingobium sp. AP50 TaxID=1884369 RepID=UPI0008B07224|nr:phage tail tube protein [Sphingobium sp. AP50]SEJ87519.1 hypothetical protein SAMN05518849_11684 [Sphingobium sp. AP50]